MGTPLQEKRSPRLLCLETYLAGTAFHFNEESVPLPPAGTLPDFAVCQGVGRESGWGADFQPHTPQRPVPSDSLASWFTESTRAQFPRGNSCRVRSTTSRPKLSGSKQSASASKATTRCVIRSLVGARTQHQPFFQCPGGQCRRPDQPGTTFFFTTIVVLNALAATLIPPWNGTAALAGVNAANDSKQQSLTDETGGHITVSWADTDPEAVPVPHSQADACRRETPRQTDQALVRSSPILDIRCCAPVLSGHVATRASISGTQHSCGLPPERLAWCATSG
jgi:hypothetical protein